MRTVRLANILEMKHNLKIATPAPSEIVNEAKKEITLAYKYHISDDAKEPVLQLVATQLNEPWTKKLIESMIDLVGNLDSYTPAEIFTKVNSILGAITEYKTDPEKKTRNFIHDSIKISRQSDKNYREQLKSKFETALKRISGLLEKAALKLKAFLPKNVPLAGGAIEQQRKELSRDKLRNFMMTPIAKSYGLDNLEMMTKILQDQDLKQKLTTVINAIDRGHKPIDGPEISSAVAEIAALAKQKETNAPYFEANQTSSPMMPEEEEYMSALEEQQDSGDKERLALLVEQRDKAHQQRLVEQDRDRHIRSDGVVNLLNKLLLKGTYENS